jgi:hypothetical protein
MSRQTSTRVGAAPCHGIIILNYSHPVADAHDCEYAILALLSTCGGLRKVERNGAALEYGQLEPANDCSLIHGSVFRYMCCEQIFPSRLFMCFLWVLGKRKSAKNSSIDSCAVVNIQQPEHQKWFYTKFPF